MSKLFIPYIMGDLNFIHHLKTLTENGADIVEIGVPFSDPSCRWTYNHESRAQRY